MKVLFIFGIFARVTRVAAILFAGFWFVTQLSSGVVSLGPATAQSKGIAYWAHIGGFVLRLVVGLLGRILIPEQERQIARER